MSKSKNITRFTGNIERYTIIHRNEELEDAAEAKALYEDSFDEDYVEGRVCNNCPVES